MKTKISMLTAAALIVGGVSYAAAQTSSSPSSADSTKCYDKVSGQIKNKSAANQGMNKSAQDSARASNKADSATTGSASANSPARPPQAAGLPDCQ